MMSNEIMEPCLKPYLPYVLEALKEIKQGNLCETCDICSNLHFICRDWYWKDWDINEWSYELGTNILEYYFEQWEHFSGNIEYPIEGCLDEYAAQNNMWDETTKWGKLRWELLDYLIERIEDDIATKNQGK
jgi:hypothetical protein